MPERSKMHAALCPAHSRNERQTCDKTRETELISKVSEKACILIDNNCKLLILFANIKTETFCKRCINEQFVPKFNELIKFIA